MKTTALSRSRTGVVQPQDPGTSRAAAHSGANTPSPRSETPSPETLAARPQGSAPSPRSETPIPESIVAHQASRILELAYPGDRRYRLSFEFLRVYSPSAEVQGHGPGQEVLQTGKRNVGIVRIEPVGNYAIKPVFSDGHESGLYSWEVLHRLCLQHDALWNTYLKRLEAAGARREPD